MTGRAGRRALASLLLVTAAAAAATEPGDLRTVGEQSGYARTGRYDEVERLCAAYAARWPREVRCTEFGRTPEGRRFHERALQGGSCGGQRG